MEQLLNLAKANNNLAAIPFGFGGGSLTLNTATPDEVRAMLDNPAFEQAHRVHDWRKPVPEWAVTAWPKLSPEVRLALALVAGEAAEKEVRRE